MPRNVRNFWITVEPTDGTRTKPVETGPVTKDGGINIGIKMRDRGEVRDIGDILGRIDSEGRLSLVFYPNGRGAGCASDGIATVIAETVRD